MSVEVAAFSWDKLLFVRETPKDSYQLYKMGICLAEGLGVEKNFSQAMEFFHRASQEGNRDATLYLVSHYRATNLQESFELLKQAAEKSGDCELHFRLAIAYLEGHGVERNLAIGVSYLQRSAAMKNGSALVRLGRCYERGLGVELSEEKAYQYYVKGHVEGAPEAYHALGKCYLNGKGIEANIPLAFVFLKKGAALGCIQSLYRLAICQEFGIGCEIDVKAALPIYRKIARRGHLGAIYQMAIIYLNGSVVQGNLQLAERLFKVCANNGHIGSMKSLAFLFLNRQSSNSLDEKEAIQWLVKAASLGDVSAKSYLHSHYPQYEVKRIY